MPVRPSSVLASFVASNLMVAWCVELQAGHQLIENRGASIRDHTFTPAKCCGHLAVEDERRSASLSGQCSDHFVAVPLDLLAKGLDALLFKPALDEFGYFSCAAGRRWNADDVHGERGYRYNSEPPRWCLSQ